MYDRDFQVSILPAGELFGAKRNLRHFDIVNPEGAAQKTNKAVRANMQDSFTGLPELCNFKLNQLNRRAKSDRRIPRIFKKSHDGGEYC